MIVTIVTDLQIVAQSLFPANIDFWNSSNCHGFATLFGYFARIIPASYPKEVYQKAFISIFFIQLDIAIICIWVFLSYNNLLFRNSHSSYIFMIPVSLSKILLIPSLSNFFYECMNFATYETANLFFVYSLISLLFGILFSYIFLMINHSIPTFSKTNSLSWSTKDFIYQITYSILITFEAELLHYASSRGWRIALLSIAICVHTFVIMGSVHSNLRNSFMFTSIRDISYLSLLISNILMLVHEFHPLKSSEFLQYFQTFLMISYLILYFIRKMYRFRITQLAQDYLDHKNSDKLLKTSQPTIMLILANIYPRIKEDWSYFDPFIEYYSHNFLFLFFYAKFLVLNPSEKQRIRKVIKDLKRNQGHNFLYGIQTRFIETLFLQYDVQKEISTGNRVGISNYFSSLKMFWTEILLSKVDKLLTLSVDAGNNFLSVIHNVSLNSIEAEQFKKLNSVCFISKSRILEEKSKTMFSIVAKDHMYNTQNVINLLKVSDNQYPNISREVIEARANTRSIFIWQFFAFYLPFFLAAVILLLFTVFQYRAHAAFWPYLDLFKSFINVSNYFQASKGLIPFIVLSETNICNMTKIGSFINSADLYPSKLNNVRSDAILCMNQSIHLFEYVKTNLLTFINSTLVNEISNTKLIEQTLMFKDHFISFIPSMELTFVRQFSQFDSSIKDLIYVISTNLSVLLYYKNFELIDFMCSYAYNMTNMIPETVKAQTLAKIGTMMMAIYFLSGIFFIFSAISIFFLLRSYLFFFRKLLSISKNEISALITKLGSSNSSLAQYQFDVRYNINLLSYKAPPSSFQSNRNVAIILLIVDLILITVATMAIIPLKNSLVSSINNLYFDFNEMKLEAVILPFCFKLSYSITELAYLYKTGNVKGSHYAFFLNLLKQTVDDASKSLNAQMSSFGLTVNDDFFQTVLDDGYSIHHSFQIMINNLYQFYTDLINEEPGIGIEEPIGYVFRFINNIVTDLSVQSALTMNELYMDSHKMNVMRPCLYILGLFLVFGATDLLLRRFKNGTVLCSVPISTISIIDSNDNNSSMMSNDLLNTTTIFPKIGAYVLLVDKNNIITEMTNEASLFFEIEPNSMTINELVRRIEKYPVPHVFPPEKTQSQTSLLHPDPSSFAIDDDNKIEIDARVPTVQSENGQDVFLSFRFIQTGLEDSAFAVVIEDITDIQTLIVMLNEEANKVRMLVAQLVPAEISANILSDPFQYQPLAFSKLAIATFYIENMDLEETKRVHTYLSSGLQKYPSLTYLGRSLTCFRIVTSLFDPNISIRQFTNQLIRFSFNFVKQIQTDSILFQYKGANYNHHEFAENPEVSPHLSGSTSGNNIALNQPAHEHSPVIKAREKVRKIDRTIRVSNSFNLADITALLQNHQTAESLKVRCGIHIDGPYFTCAFDSPPYFNIVGECEDISLLIGMKCTPNQVNISRNVYEKVFDLNDYHIVFENEVYTLDGVPVQAYTVVDCNKS